MSSAKNQVLSALVPCNATCRTTFHLTLSPLVSGILLVSCAIVLCRLSGASCAVPLSYCPCLKTCLKLQGARCMLQSANAGCEARQHFPSYSPILHPRVHSLLISHFSSPIPLHSSFLVRRWAFPIWGRYAREMQNISAHFAESPVSRLLKIRCETAFSYVLMLLFIFLFFFSCLSFTLRRIA